jgi:hypothetical protein
MIVVDSSVWIDHFNGRPTREVEALSRLGGAMLLVGDLIMAEVLQGFASENAFRGRNRSSLLSNSGLWAAMQSQSLLRAITAGSARWESLPGAPSTPSSPHSVSLEVISSSIPIETSILSSVISVCA